MTFDFTNRGMPVGPKEFTFLTLEPCNCKGQVGAAHVTESSSVQ